jgi:hypothetical protein
MADVTAEFFEDLAERGHEPLLGNASGTMRFGNASQLPIFTHSVPAVAFADNVA